MSHRSYEVVGRRLASTMRTAGMLLLAVALISCNGCATTPQPASANVGQIVILPPAGPRGVYEVFTRAEFDELLLEVHQKLEACGWNCASPIVKRQFPLMETVHLGSYRHPSQDFDCKIHATPGVVGIGFHKPVRQLGDRVALNQDEMDSMNATLQSLADMVKARHPTFRVELETPESRRPK
jgi:hypothetical protein